eukprot:1161741-Pelagomonas_calceolata.AAC.5
MNALSPTIPAILHGTRSICTCRSSTLVATLPGIHTQPLTLDAIDRTVLRQACVHSPLPTEIAVNLLLSYVRRLHPAYTP